jgi:hypothetical protein
MEFGNKDCYAVGKGNPMQKSLALIMLLSCAVLSLAQGSPRPASEQEETLLPPPMITSFEHRRLYRPGAEKIDPPVVISQPEPKPLKDMRAARVVLWCVVGKDGKAHMISIAKRDTMESEMKAVDNLRQWTFKPAQEQKSPHYEVDMLMTVEVVWR